MDVGLGVMDFAPDHGTCTETEKQIYRQYQYLRRHNSVTEFVAALTTMADYNNYNTGYYDAQDSAHGYSNYDSMGAEGYYSDPNVAGVAAYGEEQGYVDNSAYYSQGYDEYPPEGFLLDYSAVSAPSLPSIKDGSLYFHSEMLPPFTQCAVTAIAWDASVQAIYMASTTQNFSSTRWKSHQASMLATHNTMDGMLYSSVAGHPEASSSTLQTVYECIYGIPKTIPVVGRQHIPPHAYRAPYGGFDVGGNTSHMGITTILPLDGYNATISPAAIRIHSHGGLQLHDCDIEGMLTATIHPHSDHGTPSHISVGGIPCPTHDGAHANNNKYHRGQEVHCIDLWQGLRIVSSRSFKDRYETQVAVTTLATSHERGLMVAGCSDGQLRLLDSALREVGTVPSHKGGVASMSISHDGMLIATTGYSSRLAKNKDSSILYAFPDPTIYVYDIRRLGQAGIPHRFAGAPASPRHVAFLPDIPNIAVSNRLVVASGQAAGGLQLLVPLETEVDLTNSFIVPPLQPGEAISAMAQADDDLALGTSQGRVLTYKYAGYDETKTKTRITTTKKAKESLVLPPTLMIPPVPPISIDPKLLLTGNDPDIRPGDERLRALVSTYILRSDPKVSCIGNTPDEALPYFGPIGATKIIPSSKRTVAPSFLGEVQPSSPGDFILTIPTSKFELDLLADHNPLSSKRYKGKKGSNSNTTTMEPKLNPNKLLYNVKLSSLCYEDGGKKKYRGLRSSSSSGEMPGELPHRYRLQLRAQFRSSAAFDPCDYNDTGLFPGWEYAPTMPNAFASPVIVMLYFLPEVLSVAWGAQYDDKMMMVPNFSRAYEKSLTPELGFLFYQMESLSSYGLLYPPKPGNDPMRSKIGAWIPSNFLTALATLPEAEQLQILDGSPAAVDLPRRPEAFYRFLAYQLDKELSKYHSTTNTASTTTTTTAAAAIETKLLDSLQGIDFICSNQFITGSSPPSHSTTRAMTLELCYDAFLPKKGDENKKPILKFGNLLQHSLCRETRLRAWNSKSKAYETIVQRKIVTSLPLVLTIACSCAGRKEDDGLWIWRADDTIEPWLPEIVEIELTEDGSHIVRQLAVNESGEQQWLTFTGQSPLPPAVSQLVSEVSTKQKRRYRLDAVLSFINDSVISSVDDDITGHHVIHSRIPLSYKQRILKQQTEMVTKLLTKEPNPSNKLVLTAGVKSEIYQQRLDRAEHHLQACSGDDEMSSSWVLFNGFAVSNATMDDARTFHDSFKEPCLLIYRAIDYDETKLEMSTPPMSLPKVQIPPQVMNARSLATGPSKINTEPFKVDSIYEGKLVAFDAEFVSVQEEESTHLETGSKMVLRETRHAVGRISIIDCETRQVLVDDHVLPRERVVDYLTRFSGIVPEDLDPSKTHHNLISTRGAYLKLRYLMEQGCIFVGHGLRQDFATVNLVVPPHQILDTVEIYHQPGMRYISLRFLTNYVLGRDMQQDVHDSVEDALAAFELYEKAVEWKSAGLFDLKLQEIYSHGQKNDWKLGIGA